MEIEETKSNDCEVSPKATTKGENDIRSRLRKNPNKTKYLYTDDFSEKKNKKKDPLSPLNVKEVCRSILEVIKRDPKSELFRQAAIKSFIDQKDKDFYKKKIKEPRDLGLIAKKLKIPNYTGKEFYEDLELCWSNALLFNDNNTEAYQCATYLKDLSNKLYREKNFFDVINKEKEEKEKEREKEKETISNNNTNSNTTDSISIPNKTPSKSNNKNNSSNKKDNKKKEREKDNEKSEIPDTISSNSNYSSKTNNTKKNNNSDSSYSEELKNTKYVGKKRKRTKNKEDHKDTDENGDKKSVEKKSLDKDKTKVSKKKKKKKMKSSEEETKQDSLNTSHNHKVTLDDIKKKYPINHQIISSPDDIGKIMRQSKSNSIKTKKGKNKKYNSKNKSNVKNSVNNSKIKNHHHPAEINNRKASQNSNINTNDNNKNNKDNNNNTNNNNSNNKNKNKGVDINLLSMEDKKKVFYEIMLDIYNGNNPFSSNSSIDANNNPKDNDNNNSEKNILTLYDPLRYKTENKELSNYDKNCNGENVHNIISLNLKKKLNAHNGENKDNKIPNNSNDIKSVNNIYISSPTSSKDKKDDKNMQLRLEIAKYFDNLSDNGMIELLVYTENIRPQAIRMLENDTIYLDMEAFNDETFAKVFDYIKKHM